MTKKPDPNFEIEKKNAHLFSPLRIREHISNLPDDALPALLQAISEFDPLNQITAKKHFREAAELREKMLVDPGYSVVPRTFLRKIAGIYPQSKTLLEIE